MLRPMNEWVDYLNQRHAEDQDRIADNLLLFLFPLWSIVKFEELDESTALWAEAALPLLRTAYLQSQRAAAVFAANTRFASLPTSTPQPIQVPLVEVPAGVPLTRFMVPDFGDLDLPVIELDDFPEDDARISLLVESNYKVKKSMPRPEIEALDAAQVNSAGAAVRQSLKGARNVTNNVLKFDRKILGFARFTDGDPCHFCALLASRGAVYGKHSFVNSDAEFTDPVDAPNVPEEYSRIAKVHNNCRCTLRPVYSKSTSLDAEAKFYRKQWDDLYKSNPGASPEDMVKAWRDNYRTFTRTPADVSDLREALDERREGLIDEGYGPGDPQFDWAVNAESLLA